MALLLCVCCTSLLKTLWKKGEIARNEQFLLFQQCFLTFWETAIFIKFKIVICKLFQFGRVFGKGLKMAEIGEFFIERVENIMGKGENACYQHFLLFPQCLQKASENSCFF